MTQSLAIARNTLLQTARQPIYGIIVLGTLGGLALAPSLTGWTLDDDNKLLRDIGLSTLLIQGLFLACFAASTAIDAEIEDKTVLTVAAKPISRSVFIFGKYLGILAALATAHYLAGIAFYLALRHGVLQTAADKSDVTVLVFGVGTMVVVAIAATVLNYLFEWRFLPTVIALAVPLLGLGAGILLIVDRDWKIAAYETTQAIEDLPRTCQDPDVFRGIIDFRPGEGESHIEGHLGELVHGDWHGPISIDEQEYLLGLHDSVSWRRVINLLVDETRKRQGTEIAKAALLTFVAVALLAAVAVACATRLGLFSTLLVCLLVLFVGLCADNVLKPAADEGNRIAAVAYRVIPNFQFFWMVDALSETRVIPWAYFRAAAGYGVLYSAAALALAMSLFQTREVG
jgi:hypothetical protein